MLRALTGLLACCVLQGATAEELHSVASKPLGELWLNAGLLSYHFQQDKGLNGRNWGLGAEYRYSTTSALTVGQFYNSDRRTSHYAGWYWQPLAYGQLRFGAVMGGFDGYPRMRNGGWFPAALPAMSYEAQRVGVNVYFIPTLRDRLYGALSLQLKLRID